MDKTYSPKAIEQRLYAHWETSGYFQPKSGEEAFCMMLPPPNITGSLHMGHGFQNTLMDVLIRYKRMSGAQTLWQPGTDHAGISTQLVVEGQLAREGLSRQTMSREAFLERVWQWKETSGGTITSQMRRMGSSVDWSRERFTMDEGLSAAVQKVFIQLYEEGLIYRGTRLVNWDPKLGTAISDLEVISEEEEGSLWYIRYPVIDSNQSITVATTRPETMLGDMAVAVHPEDTRYQDLIGKMLHLPLCERTIPVIADTAVDPAFGTGCVKITPAHDFNDYNMGTRHALPLLSILTKTATINSNAPKAYQGLDRFVARERIVDALQALHLLAKVEPHTLKVPRGEKSNVIIEPLLTEQWYVGMQLLARPAIDAVKKGEIRFYPDNWSKTYFQWMNHIEDWCISRQLWWGHRIPAWYDDAGKIYVGLSENDVRFKHHINDSVRLTQDEDVLDTWFSSALWPFTTLGWPDRTPELDTFYPTSVLLTGFDIIFFWVARMAMMGLKFTGKVPFRDVVITGLICDSFGKKMSKSKGNVLDPIDIIDGISLEVLLSKRTSNLVIDSVRRQIEQTTRQQYPNGISAFGTDALRFTFCAIASQQRVVRFDLARVEGYRNFCNKLWNAARFVLMHTSGEEIDFGDGAFQYSLSDRWILSKLQHTITLCHQHISNYRFDLLANTLYDFVWHEYCDWYVELSKPLLHNERALTAMKRGTKTTLFVVLNDILKLLHPLMPFITEEIWLRTGKLSGESEKTILYAAYPEANEILIDEPLEREMEWVKTIIQSIRTIRSEINVSPSRTLPLLCKHASIIEKEYIARYEVLLKTLCKLDTITCLTDDTPPPLSASAVVGTLELLIPMKGLIDKDVELARLSKELAKLEKDINQLQIKLNNTEFIQHAPKDVVDKVTARLHEAEHAHTKLCSYQESLASVDG